LFFGYVLKRPITFKGIKMNDADKFMTECLAWIALFAAGLVSVFVLIAKAVL
jgi:hypothetical protein